MANRRAIADAQRLGGVDGDTQGGLSVDASQVQQTDHLLRARCLAKPLVQSLPEAVIAGGPSPQPAPLLQRLAAGQRPWLVLQYVQVVFQVEHLLAAPVAALMSRNVAPL